MCLREREEGNRKCVPGRSRLVARADLSKERAVLGQVDEFGGMQSIPYPAHIGSRQLPSGINSMMIRDIFQSRRLTVERDKSYRFINTIREESSGLVDLRQGQNTPLDRCASDFVDPPHTFSWMVNFRAPSTLRAQAE
ncbi:Uncharacterized protein HZ326_22858 [Fusarium oxysporum f. sp. albedinis]|nr:Uncharacterized protein HZ326_22858 [Fusarium oxysporum f. sp. albedinis]